MRSPRPVIVAMSLSGCISDLTPEPHKTVVMVVDAAAKDAGVEDAARPSRRDARVEPEQPADDDASEPPPEGEVVDAGGEPSPPPAPKGPCDLSGRWMLTERSVTSALNAQQVAHTWYYLELTQTGDALVVSKSLACGANVAGAPPFAVSMDDKKAWPSYMAHASYDGRKGSSVESEGACEVAFDKAAVVRGASVDTYRDLSVALPKIDEPAEEGVPGWEDWDADGKPGVSLRVSGAVSGTLYTAIRIWSEYGGSVPLDATTFWFPMSWDQERVTLGYDGPALLNSSAARAPDKSLHVAELARLSEEESAGDDAARCTSVRNLAPTRTPRAME